MPKRTLGTYRAAVAWYIALIEEPGTSRDEIARTLPSAKPLRAGQDRDAINDEQLAAYRALAEVETEPYRTILLLLPLTGCRISELCSLLHDHVDASRRSIYVQGKGAKNRWVDLGGKGWALIAGYLGRHPVEGACVFMVSETRAGFQRPAPEPCTPAEIRRVIAEWRDGEDLLKGVTPHNLRHTAATQMLRAGQNVKVIQEVLGHKNIRSLERYLHPGEAEKRAALEALE